MKKFNQTRQLALMLLAVLMIASCSNKDKTFDAKITFRTITLQVNTKDIRPGGDVELYASFPDQPIGVADSAYTTKVSKGDTIVWIGISSSNIFEDEVLIEQINYHGGDNLLGKNTINGQNGKVMAIVENDGDEEKYTIRFKVIKSGGGPEPMYFIDPKLKIMRVD